MVALGRYVAAMEGTDETLMSLSRTLIPIHTGIRITD